MTKETKLMCKSSIVNAIMWAAVMIGTALLVTGDLDNKDQTTLLIIHIAGWFSVDAAIRKSKRDENKQAGC
jgi:hypothetical protein